jgi:hypothetical protein
MKTNYTHLKVNQLLLVFISSFLFVSCGTYQSVYNDDGIYGDETATPEKKKVVVVNEREYRKYNDNYFTQELNRLESIDNSDVFTDVDDYRSTDSKDINEEVFNDRAHNEPWGYEEDNTVVVQVNLNTSPYWNDFYFGNYYNPWGFNNWGFRGGYNNWFWGYNPYWSIYHYGYNSLFYRNNWYRGYNYRGYNYGYKNYRYGRRTTHNNRYGRNYAINSRRGVISKRNYSKTRRNYSTNNTRVRKSTRTNPNKSNTRVRRSTNSTPQRNTRTRNKTPRRNSSSTRANRSNTSTRNNSSYRSSSSRSSYNRSSSSRSSSGRSLSGRSSSRKRN